MVSFVDQSTSIMNDLTKFIFVMLGATTIVAHGGLNQRCKNSFK
jgi:hypothetical protein